MSELISERSGHVKVITFNRPEARNALTFAMYEGLADACRSPELQGDVRALVIKGAGGKAFAAGTDMTQFREFSTAEHALDYEKRMEAILEAVERCAVPTIAAMTGACTGGGAAIAAACDIRLADERLRFGFPIARTLGNCLSIGNLNRMSALVGAGRLREMMLTARLIEADEAQAIGLVSEVLTRPEAVESRALELAEKLSQHAPLTMQATKEALRRLRIEGPGADGEDLILQCYLSADFKEGMEAFLAKRPPRWQGR